MIEDYVSSQTIVLCRVSLHQLCISIHVTSYLYLHFLHGLLFFFFLHFFFFLITQHTQHTTHTTQHTQHTQHNTTHTTHTTHNTTGVLYGDRYDFRNNVVDWDYQWSLKPAGSVVHIRQYRTWRNKGIAFEFGVRFSLLCSIVFFFPFFLPFF